LLLGIALLVLVIPLLGHPLFLALCWLCVACCYLFLLSYVPLRVALEDGSHAATLGGGVGRRRWALGGGSSRRTWDNGFGISIVKSKGFLLQRWHQRWQG
jgi:hypothetical protein